MYSYFFADRSTRMTHKRNICVDFGLYSVHLHPKATDIDTMISNARKHCNWDVGCYKNTNKNIVLWDVGSS